MPSTSRKQAVAMAIAAKGKGNLGIPVKVAKEFHAADKAKAKSGHSPFKLMRRKR